MHRAAFAYVQHVVAALQPRTRIVEFGARDVNGSVRPLFPGVPYIGVDLIPGPGVDVLGGGATYEPPSPPDTVLCLEVFEHTPDAPLIIANAAHILAPGGMLIATMATDPRRPHSGLDGGPLRDGEFYRNVRPDDLVDWLHVAGFTDDRLSWMRNSSLGDLYMTAWKEGGNAEEPELHDLRELRPAPAHG